MLILGIETSCDDTAASVVADGSEVLSSVVSSQDDIHSLYGGIVPELASRRHIEAIIPVVEEALKRAGADIDKDVDAIAVTRGPGLVGSILIGLNFAKSVSYAKKKPLVSVNHLEAHPLAVFLKDADNKGQGQPEFPFVALVVSGGHTALLKVSGFNEYSVLGQTRDDAAGEAFDKVAKLLGLGYPGGVAIDRLAKRGDAASIRFKRPLIKKGNLEFSFSGLKTAVLTHLKGLGKGSLEESELINIAASFQEAAVDVLVTKAFWALEQTGSNSLVAAGGVACNSRLRARLAERAESESVGLFIPPPCYCSDNAAMVALLGYHLLKEGAGEGLDLNASPEFLS